MMSHRMSKPFETLLCSSDFQDTLLFPANFSFSMYSLYTIGREMGPTMKNVTDLCGLSLFKCYYLKWEPTYAHAIDYAITPTYLEDPITRGILVH